jgi:hypothetical protein
MLEIVETIVQSRSFMFVGVGVVYGMGIYAAYRAGIAKKNGDVLAIVGLWLFASLFDLFCGALVCTAI